MKILASRSMKIPAWRTMKTPFIALAALALMACDHEATWIVAPRPPQWIADAVVRQAHESAPDARLVGDIHETVAYGRNEHADWQLQLDANTCYWFSAAGDRTVAGLALYLWDPTGKRVDSVRNRGPRALLAHCVFAPGIYKVQAKVNRGYGHYQLGVFAARLNGQASPHAHASPPVPPVPAEPAAEGPPPPAAPPPPAVPAPGAEPKKPAEGLDATLDGLAKREAPDAKRVGQSFDGNGKQTDWYLQLDKERCYWLIGAGDGGIKQLHLYLWDPRDKRVTVSKSDTNRVRVGVCPELNGMYHFQARVAEGDGRYQVGVYARAR